MMPCKPPCVLFGVSDIALRYLTGAWPGPDGEQQPSCGEAESVTHRDLDQHGTEGKTDPTHSLRPRADFASRRSPVRFRLAPSGWARTTGAGAHRPLIVLL